MRSFAARPWLACLALLLAAAAARSLAARADALDDGVAAASRGLVVRLEAFAGWCDGQRLPGERDRAFRRILGIDPENARARAALRYKRAKKDGPWVQAPDYKEPRDLNPALLTEAARRRAEAAKAFREETLAALGAAGPAVPAGRRERVVEIIIDLAPEDGEARRARGDVERDGRFSLAETVDAEARRKEIEASVRRIYGAVPKPGDDADALAHGWLAGSATKTFEVRGQVEAEECTRLVRTLEAGRAFLAEELGETSKRPFPAAVLLFPDYGPARRWVEREPKFADFLRVMEQGGGGMLPDGRYINFIRDAGMRESDPLIRLVTHELWIRFPGRRRGWMLEGLAQRICWHLLGRHGPPSIDVRGTERSGAAGAEEEEALPELSADRMPAAARALGSEPARRMRAVLTMNLNAMRPGDALAAYALSAYLLEGRRKALVPFLEASMKSDDADAICRDSLGTDAEALAWRVRRFAIESAPR